MNTQSPEQQFPEDIYDEALGYVLGLSEPERREAVDRQIATNELLQKALKSATDNASLVAEFLPRVAPRSCLKARFLASIGTESRADSTRESLGALRSHEGKSRQTKKVGITYKPLYFDKVSGLLTMLVRMEPGASFPAHRHSRVEQCLVLEGDLIHDEHVYGPGDFTWAEAGTIDPALHTRAGNLLLIIGAPGTEKV